MAELYEHIGQKIRELRLSYRNGALSQDSLAEKIKVPANTISRWETATYKPTAEDLDKLARFFEIPITIFFPNLQSDDTRVNMLASATGGLTKSDFDEVVRYAEFRKARSALKGVKRARQKT